MIPELIDEQNDVEKQPFRLPFPEPLWGRLLYALFLVGMPIISFVLADDVIRPEWQSGRLSDYVGLLLNPEASLLFLVLLSYSVTCYILLLVNVEKFARLFLVRLGIYTGVLLAAQYSVLIVLAANSPVWWSVFIPVWMSLPILIKVYPWVASRWGHRVVIIIIGVLIVSTSLVLALIDEAYLSVLIYILIGLVIGAPFWSFLIALKAATWLFKNYETKPGAFHFLGITAWIGLYAAAWRHDVLKMLELYSALPTSPPDCYIATAAAQGHPHIVRSRPIQLTGGRQMSVNSQLQRLKCFELTLLVTAPRLHAVLRSVYDFIGPIFARRIKNPFVADLAYIVLVPFEWLATRVLRRLLPEFEIIANAMYIGRMK